MTAAILILMTSLASSTTTGCDVIDGTSGGHVTVIAAVQANLRYSRRQALSLDELSRVVVCPPDRQLKVIGFNSLRWPAPQMSDELTRLVNFTVVQSTQDDDHWSRLGLNGDDILVYDSWYNLAHYVPFPRSYVPYRYVEAAILSAMYDGPCDSWHATAVNVTTSAAAAAAADDDDECAEFDDRRCHLVTARQRQATHHVTRLAARCCRRRQRGRYHRQHQRHPPRRCICMPNSSDGLNSCLCRSLSTHGRRQRRSNCFCSLSAGQLADHCPSCTSQNSWTSSNGAPPPQLCQCHLDFPSGTSTYPGVCSCHDPPEPYGRYAGGTGGGYCSRHGGLWPGSSASWPWSPNVDVDTGGRRPWRGTAPVGRPWPDSGRVVVPWSWPDAGGEFQDGRRPVRWWNRDDGSRVRWRWDRAQGRSWWSPSQLWDVDGEERSNEYEVK